MTQTLYDSQDYEVDADTIEAAAAQLDNLQDACSASQFIELPRNVRHLNIRSTSRPDLMAELDPHEIVEGGSGVVEIDDNGRKIRDIVFEASET